MEGSGLSKTQPQSWFLNGVYLSHISFVVLNIQQIQAGIISKLEQGVIGKYVAADLLLSTKITS